MISIEELTKTMKEREEWEYIHHCLVEMTMTRNEKLLRTLEVLEGYGFDTDVFVLAHKKED